MKHLLLHLSDIHFKESKGQNPVLSRAEQIVAAAASTAPTASCCFVVVTGDIAFSGKQAEYTFADKFFSELRDRLRARLPECDLHFVLVPGNHDCDFSQSDKVRELLLLNLAPEDIDEAVYSECTKVQSNYEDFATDWRAGSARLGGVSKVYRQEMHDLPGGTVEFRLINSAWMSTEKERQGSLLFPVELLRSDSEASPAANLVVTILHHPYNWFEATNARDLRNEVEATSDIILTGHEHDGNYYHKERITGERTEYVEGAILQDPDNPQKSLFNVLVIDVDEEMQQVHTFSWDRDSDAYEPDGTSVPIPFLRNRYRLRKEFILDDSFKKFLTDPGAPFTHPEQKRISLDDLFVYPDLRQLNLPGEKDEWATALVSGDQVPAFVLNHRHVLLIGSEKCGKTALSKTLFQDLRRSGFVPIYVSGSEFKSHTEGSVYSVVERSFGKAYTSPSVNRFRQLEYAKTAIIVDDFHKSRANARGRDLIINTLESLFGIVVLLGNEQLRFDDLISEREEEPALWHFTHCEIQEFGNLRRADLVEKWCFLGRRFTHDEGELSRRAAHAERLVCEVLGNDFIPSYPIFILVILQQMEARTPLITTSTSSSYGFLYESLLTMALASSSRLDVGLDTQYSYLSEFAYFLFESRAHSVGTGEAVDWHQWFCKEYSRRLDFEQILDGFCDASVLCIDDNTVSFRYSYMYYYFVGRYFRDHIHKKAIRNHISLMSKRLHHTESANILLFLCYLSKDPFILSSILEASSDFFSSYPDCDLVKDTEWVQDLMTSVPQFVLDSSHPEERRRKLLALKDELEVVPVDQEEDKAMLDEPVGLDGDLQEHLQINVAFKTIQILGQVLRNFPGSLKRGQKLELAKESYSLGLRMLKFMFDAIEAHKEHVVEYLVEFLRSRYPKWSNDRLVAHVENFIFHLMEGLAFVVVKQVSDSVGLEALVVTFKELLEEDYMLSNRFIDLSVQLDCYGGFPEREVLKLAKDTRKNPFSAHLLRHLVWHYFYIYPSGYRLRQSICAKLGIKLLPATIYDKRVKRLKG